MIELTRYFDAVDGRGSYWARQQRLFVKQREETEKREKLEDRAEADVTAFSAGAVVATDIQIQAFSKKLETHETATVEALIANDRAMELVQGRLDAFLAQAYVLEDGRRVFKTEDGTLVFDEFGEEVGAEDILPDAIDDSFPSWEDVQPVMAERDQLLAERADILEFQERIDEARDEIAGGEMTVDELDALDAELTDLMPPSVATHVPGMEPTELELVENTKATGLQLPGMPVVPS